MRCGCGWHMTQNECPPSKSVQKYLIIHFYDKHGFYRRPRNQLIQDIMLIRYEKEKQKQRHTTVFTQHLQPHIDVFLFSMFSSLALCDHNHHTHFISGLWPEDMNSVRKIRLKIHGVRFVVLYNCTQTIPFKCEEKSNKLNRPKPDWTFNVHKNNGKRSLRPGSEKQVKLKTIESANSNGFSLFCTLWLCVGRQRWECATTMASYAYERIQNLTKMLPFSLL